MFNVKPYVLILSSTLFLSACQSNYGQGELRLTGSSLSGLEKYMAKQAPIAFAVSEDGTSYQYYYCPDVQCRGIAGAYQKVIEKCEDGFRNCSLLVSRKKIVWNKPNGLPYTLTELRAMSQGVQHNSYMSESDPHICKHALNPEQDDWSEDKTKRAYIKVALIRNLTPADCALHMKVG